MAPVARRNPPFGGVRASTPSRDVARRAATDDLAMVGIPLPDAPKPLVLLTETA